MLSVFLQKAASPEFSGPVPPTTKHLTDSLQPLDIMNPEEFFYQVFEALPRQGPGCTGATRKAYSHLPVLSLRAEILDVGCGSGAQTRNLAALTGGTITAVDNHRPFLDTLATWARRTGLSDRIRIVCASMNALPFKPAQFDLIWSEGAVFIIGFEKGLAAWKPFLKKGGFMVVSDAAWFESDPPQELVQWWTGLGEVPLTEDQLRELVKKSGLRLIATYRLPEAGWWDNYYIPMLARIADLRKTYGGDPALAAIPDSFEKEAEMYRKFKRYYGYTFFIMQNP